ncbi:hypothetical protein FQN54_004914 [Arachnomyces sp. PD_36]|nr:hypothetical protein FQN54_004914 [Arachnomyces sp. PD_36]
MVWLPGHTKSSGICSIAVLCLLAVLPSVQAMSVYNVFAVAQGDEKGSCDDVSDLDDIFQETLDMSYAAFDKIDKMIGKQSSLTTRRSFYALFGINVSDYHKGVAKLPKQARNIITAVREATDGAYWDPNAKDYVVDPESAKEQQDPCDNATGFAAQNSIVLCPSVFKSFRRNLMDVKNDQSSISQGEALYATYGSVPGIFLHELTHLLNPDLVIDQPGYDNEGNMLPPSEKSEKSYGFNRCTNLAFAPEGPSLAATNADTYHVFATMMYLDEWDWASGVSEPFRR